MTLSSVTDTPNALREAAAAVVAFYAPDVKRDDEISPSLARLRKVLRKLSAEGRD